MTMSFGGAIADVGVILNFLEIQYGHDDELVSLLETREGIGRGLFDQKKRSHFIFDKFISLGRFDLVYFALANRLFPTPDEGTDFPVEHTPEAISIIYSNHIFGYAWNSPSIETLTTGTREYPFCLLTFLKILPEVTQRRGVCYEKNISDFLQDDRNTPEILRGIPLRRVPLFNLGGHEVVVASYAEDFKALYLNLIWLRSLTETELEPGKKTAGANPIFPHSNSIPLIRYDVIRDKDHPRSFVEKPTDEDAIILRITCVRPEEIYFAGDLREMFRSRLSEADRDKVRISMTQGQRNLIVTVPSSISVQGYFKVLSDLGNFAVRSGGEFLQFRRNLRHSESIIMFNLRNIDDIGLVGVPKPGKAAYDTFVKRIRRPNLIRARIVERKDVYLRNFLSPKIELRKHFLVRKRLAIIGSRIASLQNDPWQYENIRDLLPSVRKLSRLTGREIHMLLEERGLKGLQVVHDWYEFALMQRCIQGNTELFDVSDSHVAERGGIYKVIGAANGLVSWLVGRIHGGGWPGYVLFGKDTDFCSLQTIPALNLPFSGIFTVESWWGIFHEVGHIIYPTMKNIIYKSIKDGGMNFNVDSLKYRNTLEECFCDLFAIFFGFGGDVYKYYSLFWNYLYGMHGSLFFRPSVLLNLLFYRSILSILPCCYQTEIDARLKTPKSRDGGSWGDGSWWDQTACDIRSRIVTGLEDQNLRDHLLRVYDNNTILNMLMGAESHLMILILRFLQERVLKKTIPHPMTRKDVLCLFDRLSDGEIVLIDNPASIFQAVVAAREDPKRLIKLTDNLFRTNMAAILSIYNSSTSKV